MEKYIPRGPYLYKGSSLEWLFFYHYHDFLKMYKWAQKTLFPTNPYRLHLELLVTAGERIMTKALCVKTGCNKTAGYFSVRTSYDGQISLDSRYILCDEHAQEINGYDHCKFYPLKFSSILRMRRKKDQKDVHILIKEACNIERPICHDTLFNFFFHKEAFPDISTPRDVQLQLI